MFEKICLDHFNKFSLCQESNWPLQSGALRMCYFTSILEHCIKIWLERSEYISIDCQSRVEKMSGTSFRPSVMKHSAPYLISLILSTMPLLSYQTNYLFFSIPSLFGLVDNIIKFKGGHMFNYLPYQSDTSSYSYIFIFISYSDWIKSISVSIGW